MNFCSEVHHHLQICQLLHVANWTLDDAGEKVVFGITAKNQLKDVNGIIYSKTILCLQSMLQHTIKSPCKKAIHT